MGMILLNKILYIIIIKLCFGEEFHYNEEEFTFCYWVQKENSMKEYQDNKIRKKNKAFFILIFFRYQFRYFFRYQIFPIPVPILFSGTKFFRYRYRYFFPVPNFSDTGSDTTKKNENSRYREFPVPVRHTLVSTHTLL